MIVAPDKLVLTPLLVADAAEKVLVRKSAFVLHSAFRDHAQVYIHGTKVGKADETAALLEVLNDPFGIVFTERAEGSFVREAVCNAFSSSDIQNSSDTSGLG